MYEINLYNFASSWKMKQKLERLRENQRKN